MCCRAGARGIPSAGRQTAIRLRVLPELPPTSDALVCDQRDLKLVEYYALIPGASPQLFFRGVFIGVFFIVGHFHVGTVVNVIVGLEVFLVEVQNCRRIVP